MKPATMRNKQIQIKTIFGIAIPPRKNRNRKNGYTLRFVLTGWVPSKKNLHKAVVVREEQFKWVKEFLDGKESAMITRPQLVQLIYLSFGKIVNTQSYKDWEKEAVETIREQMQAHVTRHGEKKGLIFPIPEDSSISVYTYWKDKHGRDTINKLQSIFDALVKAKCLPDDDYFSITPIVGDAECLPDDQLLYHITTIDITIYNNRPTPTDRLA